MVSAIKENLTILKRAIVEQFCAILAQPVFFTEFSITWKTIQHLIHKPAHKVWGQAKKHPQKLHHECARQQIQASSST